MIDATQVKKYCREDISLIENYAEAVSSEEKYHCHHRLELNDGIILTKKDLANMGLYYKRPASELIFMKRAEHIRLHKKGRLSYFHDHKFIFKGSEHNNAHQVFQLDKLTKKILKIWDCVRDAASFIGKHNQGILDCCYGKQKTCGGYCWCYPDDYEKRYGVIHTLL